MIYNVDLLQTDAAPASKAPTFHLDPKQAKAFAAYQTEKEQEGAWKPYAAMGVAAVAMAALFVLFDKNGGK